MMNKDVIEGLFWASPVDTKGGQLCISHKDELLVLKDSFDLDEMVNTYSLSKMIVSMAMYCAWECGDVCFEKPVCYYWPEFAAAGKEKIKVRDIMEHSSGVPHFGEKLSTSDFYDWDKVVSVLSRTSGVHCPGKDSAYHARTFGFLLGEIIRRATGLPFSQYVEDKLSDGRDRFYFGVPDIHLPKVKSLSTPCDIEDRQHVYRSSKAEAIPRDSAPYASLVFGNPVNDILSPNDIDWLKSSIPSSGGVSNAFMIVNIMRKFFERYPASRDRILSLTKEGRKYEVDKVLGIPVNWVGGFEANNGEFGDGLTRFGYRAIGGSLAFFDLHEELFFSYTTSLMLPQPGLHPAHDPRIENILEAL